MERRCEFAAKSSNFDDAARGYDAISGLRFVCRSGEAAAACGDEGTDAKENVEEAEEREGSLLYDRGGVREGDAAGETNGVDGCGDHEQKDKQGHGDGDGHPQHALL